MAQPQTRSNDPPANGSRGGIDGAEVGPDAVGGGPRRRLGDVPRRQIDADDPRPAAGQHDRRHAVAAAEVEHVFVRHVAEGGESGADPGFVVEVVGVGEGEGRALGGALGGLAVVERPLGVEARRGAGHP